MKYLLCAMAMTALAGCASMPGPAAPVVSAARTAPQITGEALPPQILAPGECGLFAWTSEAPHRFILFENESAQRVQIAHGGEILQLDVPPQRADFLPGDRIDRIYPAENSDRVFVLSGAVGEPTRSGVRIERALLKARQADGTEIVRPVLGVRSCRSEMPVAPAG